MSAYKGKGFSDLRLEVVWRNDGNLWNVMLREERRTMAPIELYYERLLATYTEKEYFKLKLEGKLDERAADHYNNYQSGRVSSCFD